MTEPKASRLSFASKAAVVTGGSHGIGAGCARVFVEAGAAVAIGDRDEDAGAALAEKLRATGPGRCDFVRCEMTRPEEIRGLIGAAERPHGRLDCLINKVGMNPDYRPIDDFTVEEFEALFRLNVVSAFAGCKFGLPLLRQSHGSGWADPPGPRKSPRPVCFWPAQWPASLLASSRTSAAAPSWATGSSGPSRAGCISKHEAG